MALGILQSQERLDSAVTTASAISIGSPDSATATISATVRDIRFAVVRRPGNHITGGVRVECDRRTIDATAGTQHHQSKLREGGQIVADGQQERRSLGAIRLAAARGTGSGERESAIRKAEQIRVLQGFQRDVDPRHHRAICDGIGGRMRLIERIGRRNAPPRRTLGATRRWRPE